MDTEILKKAIRRKGGVKAVATALDVSEAAVYYWQNGKRQPSDNLLNYLGLKRVERLVRI